MEILKEAIRKNIEFYGYPHFEYDFSYKSIYGVTIDSEEKIYLFRWFGKVSIVENNGTQHQFELPYISIGELLNHIAKICYELGQE